MGTGFRACSAIYYLGVAIDRVGLWFEYPLVVMNRQDEQILISKGEAGCMHLRVPPELREGK